MAGAHELVNLRLGGGPDAVGIRHCLLGHHARTFARLTQDQVGLFYGLGREAVGLVVGLRSLGDRCTLKEFGFATGASQSVVGLALGGCDCFLRCFGGSCSDVGLGVRLNAFNCRKHGCSVETKLLGVGRGLGEKPVGFGLRSPTQFLGLCLGTSIPLVGFS